MMIGVMKCDFELWRRFLAVLYRFGEAIPFSKFQVPFSTLSDQSRPLNLDSD